MWEKRIVVGIFILLTRKFKSIQENRAFVSEASCTRASTYTCAMLRHHGCLPIWRWVLTRASPSLFFFFLSWPGYRQAVGTLVSVVPLASPLRLHRRRRYLANVSRIVLELAARKRRYALHRHSLREIWSSSRNVRFRDFKRDIFTAHHV